MKFWKPIAILAAVLLLFTSCSSGSGSDDSSNGDGADKQSQADGSTDDAKSDSGGSGSTSANGTLTMDGKKIELSSVRCYLKPQDAAAGGGKILFTGQANGQTADGENVILDVSRYDEDSRFAGDDITLDIGEISDPTSYSSGRGDNSDVVSNADSTLSATDVELTDDASGNTATVSFELHC